MYELSVLTIVLPEMTILQSKSIMERKVRISNKTNHKLSCLYFPLPLDRHCHIRVTSTNLYTSIQSTFFRTYYTINYVEVNFLRCLLAFGIVVCGLLCRFAKWTSINHWNEMAPIKRLPALAIRLVRIAQHSHSNHIQNIVFKLGERK